jgi:GT2 family glycosyltransferase
MPAVVSWPAVADAGRIRLVVLTHNGGDNVVRCFEHLHRLEHPDGELELVLIDNASVDGSADAVARRYPDVTIVRTPENAGFPANNLALRDLDGVRYVGLVNDDAFVTPGYLRPLVAALDASPDVAAACPKMLFEARYLDVALATTAERPGRGDPRPLGVMISGLRVESGDQWQRTFVVEGGHGREVTASGSHEWTAATATVRIPVPRHEPPPQSVEVRLSALGERSLGARSGDDEVELRVTAEPSWYEVPIAGKPFDVVNNAGSVVTSQGYGADRGFGQRDDGSFDEPCDVFAWCGGAVLLRPQYLADVGLFDERFFLYYEDTDLSWRGRSRGWRYRYVPDAVIHHLHAATTVQGSSSFAYFTERNRLIMLAKNAPAAMADAALRDFVGKTYDAARRDVAAALVQRRRPNPVPVVRRVRALVGYLRVLPSTLASRADVRSRRLVPDDVVAEGLTVG